MQLELSILMPCLNEVRTVGICIQKAQRFLQNNRVEGEVIVADNGSTDGSIQLAEKLNARVVRVPTRGYGAALAAGIDAAGGKYVVMGDSDDSYDFSALRPFLDKLREGYDLVMGNRFRGGIARGAMPLSHRYFGNPMLTAVGRRFFNSKTCGDFYCGLRGFNKAAVQRLKLQSPGMEFALEMLIKAGMNGLRITEVPTTLAKDGRDRAPHLRSYRDGWRSLRLYLLMSPRWFFAVPGITLLVAGAVCSALLLRGPVTVGTVTFDYHTLLYASAAVILGYQSLLMAVFAKLMAVETGLHPPVTKLWFLNERGIFERLFVIGSAFVGVGIGFGMVATRDWSATNFGDLTATSSLRIVILSITLLIMGGQTALAGCFLGILNMISDRRQMAEKRLVMPTAEPESVSGGLSRTPESVAG